MAQKDKTSDLSAAAGVFGPAVLAVIAWTILIGLVRIASRG